MTIEKRPIPGPGYRPDDNRKAGENDDGVNADELMGTVKSDYSSEQDDSMLSDDAG